MQRYLDINIEEDKHLSLTGMRKIYSQEESFVQYENFFFDEWV